MTPAQYRVHANRALRRAFLRGELACGAGARLIENPYRRRTSTRRPLRGSWSEAFAKAWAVGWMHAHLADLAARTEPAVAGASPHEEV